MAPLMDSPRPGVVTINSRYARRASSVWGIPKLPNPLLQVGVLSSIASRPLPAPSSALAVSISTCVFICDDSLVLEVFKALLFCDDACRRLLRLAARPPRQVIAHHVGKHGHQHQTHGDPQTPIIMRMFPVRTMEAMMNTVAIWIYVRVV